MNRPLLEVTDLDFSYGNVQVLFGIDISVEIGEVLALLGTNGAGKSTLLRAIAGLERPTRGSIRFDGDDVTGCNVVEMVGRGVAMVPGGRAVFPDLTVHENLDVGCFALRSAGRRRVAEREEAVLSMFPRLAERASQRAGSLSGGEQQQLGLAKAFLLEPRLLCIDELSLGLAPAVVQDLLTTVRDLHTSGTTIVLVEQSLNVATSLCDRAVFLEKGEVRFQGPTSDLIERDDIARAVFLGGGNGST